MKTKPPRNVPKRYFHLKQTVPGKRFYSEHEMGIGTDERHIKIWKGNKTC